MTHRKTFLGIFFFFFLSLNEYGLYFKRVYDTNILCKTITIVSDCTYYIGCIGILQLSKNNYFVNLYFKMIIVQLYK